MIFVKFSCLIFWVQNVLISPDQNVSQIAKYPNTTNLYTTLVGLSSNCSDSGKTEIEPFVKSGIFYQEPEYFRICEKTSNYFFFSLSATAVAKINFSQSKKKSVLVEEIRNLLKKVAIEKVHLKKISPKSQLVSNLFIVKKMDGGNRPVINLKNLNQCIPQHHFKMESLKSLRDILKQNDVTCKLDLKDAYFCIPLAEESKKVMRFYWEGDLYQFLCLCFRLVPVSYVFTKLLKIPIVFLSRIDTLIIIYLDNILLIGRTAENVQMYGDTMILLLR